MEKYYNFVGFCMNILILHFYLNLHICTIDCDAKYEYFRDLNFGVVKE